MAQHLLKTFSKLAHKTVVDDWVADVVDVEEIQYPQLSAKYDGAQNQQI